MTANTLRFMPPSGLVTAESSLYRPPSFPPPDDWVVSVDNEGFARSRYGDDFWDFRAFERSATFNFKKDDISDGNKLLIKKVIHLVLYHPRLFPGKIRSCVYPFACLIKIARVCDRNGLLISEVQRFPAVHQQISEALQCTFYQVYINFLHRLRLHADVLGFEILNDKALAFMISQRRDHEAVQTPYIPPRIWTYVVKRLSECLDDFIEHQEALERAFAWLASAYKHNASVVEDESYHSPFYQTHAHVGRITLSGGLNALLIEYGLEALFKKWLGEPAVQTKVVRFSAYFNMVREASFFYIMCFSLQRISEAASLRSDCFVLERDPRLGDIAMVVGETTKTDPDSDARWIVPTLAKKAVDVASDIARLRLRHFSNDGFDPEWDDDSVPLALAPTEPWTIVRGNYRNSRKELISQLRLGPFMDRFPEVFDTEALLVTEKDWGVAVSMTPNLGKRKGFGVGLSWPLSAHQLRRTTNVNMFASNMVSDNSLQWLMKHVSQKMTLYYGKNYTNLRLNSDAETSVFVESYKAIYRQLVDVVKDSIENVRPHFKKVIPAKIVNLVEAGEEAKLIKLIEKGNVGCRRTLVGFCMKAGPCVSSQ